MEYYIVTSNAGIGTRTLFDNSEDFKNEFRKNIYLPGIDKINIEFAERLNNNIDLLTVLNQQTVHLLANNYINILVS